MSINIEEDLKNNKLIVNVKLSKRKYVSQERVQIKWHQIKEHVKKNYTPPKTHILGECKDFLKLADNDLPEQREISWIFELLPVVPAAKTKRSTPRKTKAVKK